MLHAEPGEASPVNAFGTSIDCEGPLMSYRTQPDSEDDEDMQLAGALMVRSSLKAVQ